MRLSAWHDRVVCQSFSHEFGPLPRCPERLQLTANEISTGWRANCDVDFKSHRQLNLRVWLVKCQRGTKKGGAELAIIRVHIPTTSHVLEERAGHEAGKPGIGTDIGTPLVALNIDMKP